MSESELPSAIASAKNSTESESEEESTTGRRSAPTREELLGHIRECYDSLDRIEPPKLNETAEYAGISSRPFERADGWNTLLTEAGIPTLPDLCDEWIAAYIEQGYGTSREFRTSRIAVDLESDRNRIARSALYVLENETEEERNRRNRKVELTRREGFGEHSPVIWVGELRDPNADPRPSHLRESGDGTGVSGGEC